MTVAFIRPMREHDLPVVADIEARAYEFPWSIGVFEDCLRAGYSCWTLLQDGAISGYGIVTLGAGEAHLLNLCVAPEQQGRGHARQLLGWLLNRLEEREVTVVFLEVRPSNVRAIDLYKAAGFDQIGLRRDYYPAAEGREHALVFSLRLATVDPDARVVESPRTVG